MAKFAERVAALFGVQFPVPREIPPLLPETDEQLLAQPPAAGGVAGRLFNVRDLGLDDAALAGSLSLALANLRKIRGEVRRMHARADVWSAALAAAYDASGTPVQATAVEPAHPVPLAELARRYEAQQFAQAQTAQLQRTVAVSASDPRMVAAREAAAAQAAYEAQLTKTGQTAWLAFERAKQQYEALRQQWDSLRLQPEKQAAWAAQYLAPAAAALAQAEAAALAERQARTAEIQVARLVELERIRIETQGFFRVPGQSTEYEALKKMYPGVLPA